MKRKIFLLFVSSLLFAEVGLSQITFQKIFSSYGGGGCGLAVRQTSDGGYIIGGYLAGEWGQFNMCLIRTNKYGDTLWVKKFKTQSEAIGFDVQQTKDGGYIIGGLNVNSPINGFYFVKTNYNGEVEWSRIYKGNFSLEGCSLQQTSDGGYILSGNNVSSISNEFKMYVIKTNEFGDTLWTKGYGSTALSSEYLYSIKQTDDSGYIITGSFIDTLNDNNVSLLKTDSDGNILWSKAYGGTGGEWGYDVQQTRDGGYVIAGESGSFGNPYSGYLIRTDENGNIKWTKVYNQADSIDNSLFFQSVQETHDEGFIIGGFNSYFAPNMFLLRTDVNGNVNWAKSFGEPGDDGGYSVQPTADGGYIFTGYHSGTGHGLYLVKTDDIGNSNCNQFFNNITAMTPQSQSKDPAAQIFPSDITILYPNNIVTNGCDISTPCFSYGIPDNSFTIVPNPCVADFIIYSPYYTINKIEIFNSLGEMVYINAPINDKTFTIFNKFPAGMYIVRLTTDEKILNGKLLIEKQ